MTQPRAFERSKVSEMHLVVSAEDGHLLEVFCKRILQSVQRSAVASGSSLQKALRKGESQDQDHCAGSQIDYVLHAASGQAYSFSSAWRLSDFLT